MSGSWLIPRALMLLKDAIDLIFVQRAGLRGKRETAKGYETDARQLCVYLNNPTIMNVRLDDIERYMTQMAEAGFSQNGIIHKACAFRVLFKQLRKHGHIVLDPNDIPMPRKEFHEPRVATDDQIQKVLEAMEKAPKRFFRVRNKALLLILRDTGMRIGEMRALNVDEIDLVNKRAKIQTEKSRGLRPQRIVYWYDECNEVLKEWLAVRADLLKRRRLTESALFITPTENQGHKCRIGVTGVHIAFRKASWVAGVPTLNPHSLRHRKGHLLAKSGANNSIISGVLGHSSLASSFVYTMLNDQELEETARAYGGEKTLYPHKAHG